MQTARNILAAGLLALALSGCAGEREGAEINLSEALAANHWQDAALALAQLTEARPADEQLARQRTEVLLALGDGEGALAAIDRFGAANAATAANAQWTRLRAEAEVRRGQARRALGLLEGDASAEAHRIRALAHGTMGERDRAEAEILAGLALEPRHARLNADLALHHLAARNVDAARGPVALAAAQAPASLDTLLAQGRLAEAEGNRPNALAQFAKAHRTYPDSLIAMLGHARMLAQSGKLADASKMVGPHYRQGNRNAELVVLYARIAAMQGHWDEGRKALQEIEGEIRSDPEAQLLYASALQRTGQPELARAILERTQRRNPEFMAASGMLAEIYIEEGRAEAALALLEPYLSAGNAPPPIVALAQKAKAAGG